MYIVANQVNVTLSKTQGHARERFIGTIPISPFCMEDEWMVCYKCMDQGDPARGLVCLVSGDVPFFFFFFFYVGLGFNLRLWLQFHLFGSGCESSQGLFYHSTKVTIEPSTFSDFRLWA